MSHRPTLRSFQTQQSLRLDGMEDIPSQSSSCPWYTEIRPHHVMALYAVGRMVVRSALWQTVSDKTVGLLSNTTDVLLPLVYSGWVPDALVRLGIRVRLEAQLVELRGIGCQDDLQSKMNIVQELTSMPLAVETSADLANAQHYEVPAAFYDLSLGPRKKYSSGLWPYPKTTFEESEVYMLDLYCDRAGLEDGMHIVDLGCGWGSLTLHLAERFPNAKITGISNSHSQREYILKTAKDRGFNVSNINIVTCNVADDQGALDVVQDNDRVLSIEMFEHMKNYSKLLEKVNGFLKPGGKLFVHIFSHKEFAYHFEDGNWMADHFFTGGTMPSDDLLLYFGQYFSCANHWRVNGQNYEKTSNGWLDLMDSAWKSGELKPVLAEAYGAGNEQEWYVNWRLFFLACAELFGFHEGEEWIVSHYLFERK